MILDEMPLQICVNYGLYFNTDISNKNLHL